MPPAGKFFKRQVDSSWNLNSDIFPYTIVMSDSCNEQERILSYWTAEHIQSAVAAPDINFSMSALKRFGRAIHDYWTPERIALAQPEVHAYGTHIEDDTEVKKSELGADGSLRIVPDEKVTTFPYQSVGKLFYTKVGPSGSRDSYATAWVANMSSVLHVVYTAAHNLKRGDMHAENILFVPGFTPPGSYPFGRYPEIQGGEGTAWVVDPNWNPNDMKPRYDQGLVKLDKDTNTAKYVDDVVTPIEILSNQQYTSLTEWNTIGYPVPSSQNPYGKMCERSGTFKKVSDGAVYKYGTLPQGTSGGPWILLTSYSQSSSNGVQAGNRSDIGCTLSPHFHSSSQELIKFYKFKAIP